MKKSKNNPWGYELDTMDASVRPQDDFYRYANGAWLKSTKIPDTESYWGGFLTLRLETEKQLRKILNELLAMKRAPSGSSEQMIRDMYRSAVSMDTRNEIGAAPLTPWLKKIASIKNVQDVRVALAQLHNLAVDAAWGASVDQDMKNNEQYILYIGQGGLGMPDRDYYLNDLPESVRVRTAYHAHIIAMHKLAGYARPDAAKAADSILTFETRLARVSMAKEDMRNPDNIYHKMSVQKLSKHTPQIEWQTYLKKTGAGAVKDVILMQPDFFAEVGRMLTEVSLEDWKTYLAWNVISDFAPALSSAFVREDFKFSHGVLSGRKKMKPMWRRGLGAVDNTIPDVLGKLYVERYFSPNAKKIANEMVDDLFAVYEDRIKKLEWMSSATKQKAITKLHKMTRKIGYPTKWKGYAGLTIKPDDFFGNLLRSTELERRRNLKKLGKPLDRTEWFMSPQTVNAYYAPAMNDIVFPAGILQWPFFDANADAAINYGSMGWCIGHEMTHGFDDEGSKFDSNGNLKVWWSESDRKAFEKRAKSIEVQYGKYTVVDDIPVNGKLTLGENIADLGGVAIAYEAYMRYVKRHGRININGFTPEQRFFLGYAQGDREISRPEAQKTQVRVDPHSPAEFRINGPLVNFEGFYAAFGVKKGDGMYRDPAKRTKIW